MSEFLGAILSVIKPVQPVFFRLLKNFSDIWHQEKPYEYW